MQRALLALLLLHVNSFLSTGVIIDTLWGGRPPRTAPAVLQMYVAGLRRACFPPERVNRDGSGSAALRTGVSGYGVWLEPDQLDVTGGRALTAHGRTLRAIGRCAEAAAAFRGALGLWRGPALAEFDGAVTFAPYAVRLHEEWLALRQERIGVEICQGNSIAVIGELEELRKLYPLSESLCQQLMLALGLVGRRADALRVFADVRNALVSQVGVEPGPGLQASQRAILGSWSFPDLGVPQHAPAAAATVRVCEPRLFSGWSQGMPDASAVRTTASRTAGGSRPSAPPPGSRPGPPRR
jgi:DNA-binding SARP family transcriptional activator